MNWVALPHAPSRSYQKHRRCWHSSTRPVHQDQTVCGVLEPHPSLPYYLSASSASGSGSDTTALLWEYEQPGAVAEFQLGSSIGSLGAVCFNGNGDAFAGATSAGEICLWRLHSHAEALLPFARLQCHDFAVQDVAFVNAGTCFASASTTVGIWDSLLPPSQSLVCDIDTGGEQAQQLMFSSRYQILVTRDATGKLHAFDLRQRRLVAGAFAASGSRRESGTQATLGRGANGASPLFFAAVGDDVNCWNLASFSLNATVRVPQPVSALHVTHSCIYTCHEGGSVRVLGLPASSRRMTFQ